MVNNLWIFGLLAICTNTVIPIPFEPVLLFFVAHYEGSPTILVLIGALCSAIGGVIDLNVIRVIRKAAEKRWSLRAVEADRRFYLIVLLFALLPFPFAVIRACLVKLLVHPIIYVAAVCIGRLGRYILIVHTIRIAALAGGIGIVIAFIVIAWISNRYWFASRRILFGGVPEHPVSLPLP